MDNIPLQALIIEDVEDDAQLLVNELRRTGYALDYLCVDNAEDLKQALKRDWHVVFSDFTMPHFDGMTALEIVRTHDPDLPFIFVSGTIGEERAVEAVRRGAQDYVLKDNLKRLSATIPRELRESAIRRGRRHAEERIHFLANYDALTGLPNRTMYNSQLNLILDRATAEGRLVALIHINIDRFRDINNSLGPIAGDELLKQIAEHLSDIINPSDIIARLSSDEFGLIIPGLMSKSEVVHIIHSLTDALSRSINISGYNLHIHASIGISIFPFDGQEADELHRNAMIAMHKVKQEGGKSYQYFTDDLRQKLHNRINMERELEQAIETQSFHLHYQPQTDITSGHIVSVEALLRWQHNDFGAISPTSFIPIAEESGLILPIGQWVLEESCRQFKYWQSELSGIRLPKIGINFSAFQFRQRGLLDNIKNMLFNFDIAPQSIEIEITETALMQDPDTSMRLLTYLRDWGISISLDDFGTGYSSLSYLKRFPVNTLKIDKSFISDIPKDPDDIAITRAIIAMADRLNIKVVAEGVETEEQMSFLYNEGCNLIQGYYLTPPIPNDEISNLLKKPQLITDKIPWLN